MEFTDYFNNLTDNTLSIIESWFVSRLSSTDFILMERQTAHNAPTLDPYVANRSRLMTESHAKKTQMNLHPPQFLGVPTIKRSKSAPNGQGNQKAGLYKSEHSLNFQDFIGTMKSVLQIPVHLSAQLFAKLCKPQANTSHPDYNSLIKTANFSNESAQAIFSGCFIHWVDLLNYLSTKTTFVQPVSEVRLNLKRTPKQFAHRLTIETIQMLPEIGAIFSSSRDGLGQIWCGEKPSGKMKFRQLDEIQFGLDNSQLDKLVTTWRKITHDPEKRSTKIDVVQRVISGEIPLDQIEDHNQKNYFKPLPYQLIWSLTNPDEDESLSHIMNKQDGDSQQSIIEQEGVTNIIKACRAADAPLPSGRPLPERVQRTVNFQGYISDKDVVKEEPLYQNASRQRAKSAIVSRKAQSMLTLDQLFEQGFANEYDKYTRDFTGSQHPIFSHRMKNEIKQRKMSSNIEHHARDELAPRKVKSTRGQENGGAWASGIVIHKSLLFVITTNGKLLKYSINQNGIQLKSFQKVQGVAIRQFMKWNRNLVVFDIRDPKDVIGCRDEELPTAGEKMRIQSCLLYQSPGMIGILKAETKPGEKQVIRELNPNNFTLVPEDDSKDLSGSALTQNLIGERLFTQISCAGTHIFVGFTDGTVSVLEPLSFREIQSVQVFQSEITTLQYSENTQILLVGGLNAQLVLFTLDQKIKKLHSFRESTCVLKAFASKKFDCVISVCANGVVTVWSLKQFSTLFKMFAAESISAAAWDEENGVLIIGDVDMKVFKLVGAKNEEKGSISQAHYVGVIGIVQLSPQGQVEEEEDEFVDLNADLNQSQNIIISKPEEPEGPPPAYKRPKYQRQITDFKMHSKLPSQPTYQFDKSTGKVPCCNYEIPSDIHVNIAKPKYNRAKVRIDFAQSVCQNYKMVDFDSYITRINEDNGIHLERRSGANRTTGIDLLEMVKSGDVKNVNPVCTLSGYITIDSDANIRHWSQDNIILATYKIETEGNVLQATYDDNTHQLIVIVTTGECIFFDLFTFQIQRTINVSNCARAAHLLQFKGRTYNEGTDVYSDEFQKFLHSYEFKKYNITAVAQYQKTTAFACGNSVLIFDLDAQKLSKRFVQQLLKQNSRQAVKIAEGITQPPTLILNGHIGLVTKIDACGKKLVTADEHGYICCWMGQGIAKQVMQVKEDAISSIFALKSKDYWCAVCLKNGQVAIVDKKGEVLNLFQIFTEQEIIIGIYEHTDRIIFAIGHQNNIIVCETDLHTLFTAPVQYSKLPCDCKQISSINIVNDGQNLCVTDQTGHCYYTNLLDLNSLINEQAIKDNEKELQQLYSFNENLFKLNPDFDIRFDKETLFKLTALKISGQEVLVDEDPTTQKTKDFLNSLKDVVEFDDYEDPRAISRPNMNQSIQINEKYSLEQVEKLYEYEHMEQMLRIKYSKDK
ncbi:Conserved_hypothetical protein [Hexamita inflata]|uniref:Uncharacterized protein n=1 Tax=Hexamita inflata TaxID=28002 RepID=A0AA86R815_9EUKA|nr:Conserved hypothetical protein [Hexamita inflata]